MSENMSKIQRENRETFNKKKREAMIYREDNLVASSRVQD